MIFRTPVCVLLGLFCLTKTVSAEEPRALLERAVKALGGVDLLRQPHGMHATIKGTLDSGGMKLQIEGELFEQKPRSRAVIRVEVGDQKLEIVHVSNGKDSWESLNGQLQDSLETENARKISDHVDR